MDKNDCLIPLELLKYVPSIRVEQKEGKQKLWDPIRKKYYIIQPEELVRQALILHLTSQMNYPINRLQVEKQLMVNSMKKRFDILVYQKKLSPFMIIECKSPSTSLSQLTINQVAQYNMALKAPYLLITNGKEAICAKIDFIHDNVQLLDHIPEYGA